MKKLYFSVSAVNGKGIQKKINAIYLCVLL